MSIKKRMLAAIAAMSMIVTSFVAITTASATTPTVKGTLMTADELSDYEAQAGVNISFENFDANIAAVQFDLKIPKDLGIYVNTGTDRKPVWEFKSISESTISSAVDTGFNMTIKDKSVDGEGFYTYGFIAGGSNFAPADATVTVYFSTEDGSDYAVKAGSFDLANVHVTTYGASSEVANLTVVQATTSATPTPTATATPTPTPVVTEAPTPTPTVEPTPTPTVEPTPEVTPEPTTGKGAITADANDAAAWAWKTAAAAGSSVKVTVNANGETATKAFALKAAVDGTVKVGVIVQYNPATFTSFEITDIVVE